MLFNCAICCLFLDVIVLYFKVSFKFEFSFIIILRGKIMMFLEVSGKKYLSSSGFSASFDHYAGLFLPYLEPDFSF